MAWITTASKNTGLGIWGSVYHLLETTFIFLWDSGLTVINLLTPKKRHVSIQRSKYIPPTETDSRSPCPALNALANHGVFPHDGRNITFKQLGAEVHKHFNFAPSFCFFTCNFMAGILKRNYHTDSLDLSDMSVHNGIEHDGSVTRYDTTRQPDQSIPAEDLIMDLIAASQDGKKITAADLSRIITERWAHSKATNGQFSLGAFHQIFGASNCSTLLLLLGGDIADIKPFLLEERLPDGWTSKVRSQMGLTMAEFNPTVLKVLLGINPSWKATKKMA